MVSTTMPPMAEPADPTPKLRVRDDLADAQRRAWTRLGQPGTWWDGAARVAIAAEARHALDCTLCRQRRAALSPDAVAGRHNYLGGLPDPVVEVIHRLRTDPARLSRTWLDRILAAGLSEERYVETVGVVVTVVAIDTFARALGTAAPALPAPTAGEPSAHRPAGAKPGAAWVSWIAPPDLGDDPTAEEAGLYPVGRPVANIYKAMSLVPAEVRGFFELVEAQYLPGAAMRDFSREFRAISHAQIELLAARVSALNRCVY
jgi:hypothetical protein